MTTTTSAIPFSPFPAKCWQWRSLAPALAVGVGALTKIAKESRIPGPWQAITGLIYSWNVLLAPSSVEKLTQRIIHLKSKQNWQVVSKLHHIRTLFQSSLSLLVSTTFTAAGLKEISQLLGHFVKPLESGLNAIFPWVKGIARITALFQIYDIVHGIRFGAEIRKTLALTRTNPRDTLDFCTKVLKTVERHRQYLRSWDRQLSLSKWNTAICNQIKSCSEDY